MGARLGGLVVLVISLAVVGGASPGLAESGFTITVPGGLDTPDRQVTLQGQQHMVSGIGVASPGDTLRVHVATPDIENIIYRLYLYNADQQIVASQRGTAPDFFNVDLSGLTPGSYLLVVQHDGVFKAIHPVVVRGYQVTVDAPSEALGRFLVSVQVSPEAANGTPHSVRVVVVNATAETSVRADALSEEKYRATVSVDSFEPGAYRVYAVAQGEQTVFGRQELLGVSDTIELTIGRSTATSVETTTTRVATEPTEVTDADPSSGGTVITPVGTADRTASPGLDGFGFITLLVAMVLLGGYLYRRRF